MYVAKAIWKWGFLRQFMYLFCIYVCMQTRAVSFTPVIPPSVSAGLDSGPFQEMPTSRFFIERKLTDIPLASIKRTLYNWYMNIHTHTHTLVHVHTYNEGLCHALGSVLTWRNSHAYSCAHTLVHRDSGQLCEKLLLLVCGKWGTRCFIYSNGGHKSPSTGVCLDSFAKDLQLSSFSHFESKMLCLDEPLMCCDWCQ